MARCIYLIDYKRGIFPAGRSTAPVHQPLGRGMVRTSGNWQRDGKTLILDDAAIAGLEYTLPKNWQQLWMETTPSWLNSLQLKRFKRQPQSDH